MGEIVEHKGFYYQSISLDNHDNEPGVYANDWKILPNKPQRFNLNSDDLLRYSRSNLDRMLISPEESKKILEEYKELKHQ